MKNVSRLGFAFVVTLAPIAANAQVPVYPNPNTNLDPGQTGTQETKPKAPATTGTGSDKPRVMVIGPDGKVQPQPGDDGGSRRYVVGTGGNGITDTDDPGEIYSGAVPELHVVRSGDTLWDICWYYFNDPWQWPKIWSYNTQITNPHWIYPGDLVRLLPRGVFAQSDGNGKIQDPEKQPDVKQPDQPPPAKRTEVSLKQVAFVEKSDLDKSITIEGSVDEKVLLGSGDAVYLSYPPNKPPVVGQKYSIYAPGNSVKKGDSTVGAYVRLLGTLEVDSVKQDKRARGVILEAYQEIERGNKVGPLVRTFKNVPPVPVKVDAQGSIIAMLTKDQLIGQGEVIFIDLGKKSGIEVGNRMFIVRRGDALPPKMDRTIGQDDRRFPARALGEMVVVEVGDNVSIGLVTIAVKEMALGDLVMMQKN